MHNSRWESEGGSGTVDGNSTGTPDHRIPEGCPTTAEEAASGVGSDSADHVVPEDDSAIEGDFELRFTTGSDLAEYLVELDAAVVEPGDDANTFEHEYQDRAFEHDGLWYIHGYTAGGGDNFHVEDGEILRIGQLQGETRIEADDAVLSIDDYEVIDALPNEDGDAEASSEQDLLAFVTEPDARFATYEFTATGPVDYTEAPYNSPSGNHIESNSSNVSIEETDGDIWEVDGLTGGGFGDAFLVDGPITAIDIDQPDVMWVELNGEERSPEEIIEATADDGGASEGDGFDNVIIIDGTATADSVSYSFSVSESLEPATYGEATINGDADVDGNSVDAVVDDSVDAYWFSGGFTDFRLAGNASVDVEYDV